MRFVCMAVPKRSLFVNYLKQHIPGLEVVWDKKRSARATMESALEHIGDDEAMLIEDDLLLTKGFVIKAQSVIESHRDCMIQFHSRVKDDFLIGSRMRPGSSYMCTMCTFYPSGMASRVLEFSRGYGSVKLWEQHPSGTDLMVRLFLKINKLKYWNQCPSLADHLPLQSVIDPRRSKNRRSKSFVNPELYALPIPLDEK